jgi:His/Glu/Gln/Arg/opine family amino acid ABC transporter permease subunit
MPVIRLRDVIEFLPTLLLGARYTIGLTVIVMLISVIAALLVALARLSRFKVLRYPCVAYVEFIRGTPCLMQLYYIFYVLPFFGLTLPALVAGVIGLSLNYTAYLSEVYRAGISSVPKTQQEAAECLGMSYWQSMRLVILPQAARVVLPPTVNYLLGLFKDTSLLSLITIQELMFSGMLLGATTYKYLTIFTEVALVYFAICYPVALLATWVEKKMKQEPQQPAVANRRLIRWLPGPIGFLF